MARSDQGDLSDLFQRLGPAPFSGGAPGILPLGNDDVHLWLLDPALVDDTLLAAYGGLLTEGEAEKQQRFVFARHRRQYLMTRALVRTVLSHYAPVPPEAWRFHENEHHKPAVAPPRPGLALRFNLSHCDEMIVCGVSAAGEVGVDVETEGRHEVLANLADSYLAPREQRDIATLSGGARHWRLLDSWTLKESYIKARGIGLSLPLTDCLFDVGDDGALRVEQSDGEAARAPWDFWLLRTAGPPRASISVAMNWDREVPKPRLSVLRTVPLQQYLPSDLHLVART